MSRYDCRCALRLVVLAVLATALATLPSTGFVAIVGGRILMRYGP